MNEIALAFVIFLVVLWTVPWKGYALWVAAKRGDLWWFIAILLLNTLAILEIFYIFAIAKKRFKKATPEASTASE